MKVLLISASIGTGHTQAARAIEEYWQLQYPDAEIKHVDFLSSDTLSIDNLVKETYIKMIDVFPMLYDLIYWGSQGEHKGGLLQGVASWLLKSRMLKLLRKEEPDVVIFTHPFPCGAACILKRQNLIDMPIVGVITDFASHQFWIYDQVDLYCIPDASLIADMTKAGIDNRKLKITGIPVRRLFFDIDNTREYKEDMKPAKVLVMGGGLGLGSMESALKRLDGIEAIASFEVVAGRNASLYEDLIDLADSMKTPTHVHGYTTEIPRLMKESTLLVTKAGALTCMEAVTVGIPMVFFNAIPGQEEANASLIEQWGCARWARDIHNLEDVVTALLINPQRLQKMHDAALEHRIDGAKLAVDAIVDLVNEDKALKLISRPEVLRT